MKFHLGRPHNPVEGTFQSVCHVPLSRLLQQHECSDDVGVEMSRESAVTIVTRLRVGCVFAKMTI
jgi:hypothetical protein